MDTHEHFRADVSAHAEQVGKEVLKKEAILDAAILYKGEMFTGTTHSQAIDALEKKYPDFKYEDIEETDGFVTTSGRFVKRDEALIMARLGKQLQPGSDKRGKTELYSEDLK